MTMLCPYNCHPWCRVHWDPNYGEPRRFPFWVNIRREGKWFTSWVRCGPGAIYPYRPDRTAAQQIHYTCPHVQMDLTCNYCLRHMFRPYEIDKVR